MNKLFSDKCVFISGGTGSLGKILVKTLLMGTYGLPCKIIVFSRDESKHHDMKLFYQSTRLNGKFKNIVRFIIGDIRDYSSVSLALLNDKIDIIINAAALKQVPSCEDNPYESVLTNINGAHNIIRSIKEHKINIDTVVGISTDKACKPVNVMGMTKAIQERLFISANVDYTNTRFVCVRYGNVLASRGSVIPLFHEQISNGGPITITSDDMTRFLLPLSHAVYTICNAIKFGERGDIFIPKIPSALITNIAKSLINNNNNIDIVVTGIRPGEKIHESMISEEEGVRSVDIGEFYVIKPTWNISENHEYINKSYNSNDNIMTENDVYKLLNDNDLIYSTNYKTSVNELIK